MRARRIAPLTFTAMVAAGVLAPCRTVSAQLVFQVVHAFDGTEGGLPDAALIQASDGNFYGSANGGDSSSGNNCFFDQRGCPTVFRMTPAGAVTVLVSFPSGYISGDNGGSSALIQATDGNFYFTNAGASRSCAFNLGCGFALRMTPGGAVTTLHAFSPAEGVFPRNALVQAVDGNFYGTVFQGAGFPGTAFRITPTGTLTVLHSFSGGPTDGAYSSAALIQAADGNLYGTTTQGGSANFGTVFVVTPGGSFTVLHSFSGGATDGASPQAPLIQAADGNFYGTTRRGGPADLGTVFRMTPDGAVTTLHAFAGGPTDGASPLAAIIQASDGNFYGTTSQGGPADLGTVFGMTPAGGVSVLHAFAGGPTDGASPLAAIIHASDGSFYGTTSRGGVTGRGTVFRLMSVAEPRLGLDRPTDGSTTGESLTVSGWAVDRGALLGTGVDAVHVYAYPEPGSDTQPVFLGAATIGAARPDVGDVFGSQFENSGFTLAVAGLRVGRYQIAAFLHSTVSNTFTLGANATITVTGTRDFDGDGKTDPAMYRPSQGEWWWLRSRANYASNSGPVSWGGGAGAIPVPGDYDGDGLTDPAVYYPAAGEWWILYSTSHFTTNSGPVSWGGGAAIPLPGDYDGDGRTDPAVYFPSTGEWWILNSTSHYATNSGPVTWGFSTDIPVPADYDGDGRTDPAVYRPSTGQWFFLHSTTSYTTSGLEDWGLSTDTPVPGDYDGDGMTDPAVYRPSTGEWFVLYSSTNYTSSAVQNWGLRTDVPVPGDYDGDGRTDLAVYRPSSGQWLVLTSSSNYTAFLSLTWGLPSDVPILGR